MAWVWRYENAGGEVVDPDGAPPADTFPTQADAETWIGETWRELLEDGVDAILYLSEHAQEFNIDLEKIAVSGFSSGGNMACTVPLRLQEQLKHECAAGEERRESVIAATRPRQADTVLPNPLSILTKADRDGARRLPSRNLHLPGPCMPRTR